jgi:hypothetical protein
MIGRIAFNSCGPEAEQAFAAHSSELDDADDPAALKIGASNDPERQCEDLNTGIVRRFQDGGPFASRRHHDQS